ncbi:MAG: LysM peptidoglycan-binding domain-containing protein [Exilispira sp.]
MKLFFSISLIFIVFSFFSFSNFFIIDNNNSSTDKNNIENKLNLLQPIIQRIEKPKILLTIGKTEKYKVQKNDTLYGIAKKFNITIESLRKANNLNELDIIKAGMMLIIPANSFIVYSPVDNFEYKLKTEKILLLYAKSSIIFSPLMCGDIVYIGQISGFGKSVIIKDKEYSIVLSNLSDVFVQYNQKVNLQTCIGFNSVDNILNLSVFLNDKMLSLKEYLTK